MKGQYLAIETTLTLAMGIALATGTVMLFSNYQDSVASTTEEKQVEAIISNIQTSIFILKQADSGREEINLPEKIGGSSYQVSLGEEIKVNLGEKTYSRDIQTQGLVFEGDARGGTVNLYRRGDKFVLRG